MNAIEPGNAEALAPQEPAIVADTLYKAMKGWGTDEGAIYNAASGVKSQAAWDAVQREFQRRHGDMQNGDLLASLKGELNRFDESKLAHILRDNGVDCWRPAAAQAMATIVPPAVSSPHHDVEEEPIFPSHISRTPPRSTFQGAAQPITVEASPPPSVQWYEGLGAARGVDAVDPPQGYPTIIPDDLQPDLANRSSDTPSIEELRMKLEERDHAVATLQAEIAALTEMTTTGAAEAKLQQLESKLGGVEAGDTLKIRSPALVKIAEAAKVDADRLHQKALKHYQHVNGDSPLIEVGHTHAGPPKFALGRSYMPIDRVHQHERSIADDQKDKRHPTIHEVHYSGHIPRPVTAVQATFVGPGGYLSSGPLANAGMPQGTKFIVPVTPSAPAGLSPEATQTVEALRAEAAIADHNRQRNRVGDVEVQPVDWLGLVKRDPWAKEPEPKPDLGWQMPRWMY